MNNRVILVILMALIGMIAGAIVLMGAEKADQDECRAKGGVSVVAEGGVGWTCDYR